MALLSMDKTSASSPFSRSHVITLSVHTPPMFAYMGNRESVVLKVQEETKQWYCLSRSKLFS